MYILTKTLLAGMQLFKIEENIHLCSLPSAAGPTLD